jgi:DNA-binding MurR/RpiR family transcriptional regulator
MSTETNHQAVEDEALEARILCVLPKLTSKQHRLARALLDNELFVAFASAQDLGRRAGVDAATVVRFSRLLGYDGYADLRASVRRRVPQFLTAVERVKSNMQHPERTRDVSTSVFAQDIRNIEETARLNPPETIAEIVSLLDGADRVFCIGHGISAFVADHLAHQLTLVGIDALRAPRSVVEGAIAHSSLTKDDVVVVVTVWRYLLHTLMLGQGARAAGVKTIGLTDSKAAPIAAHSDLLLVADTETAELGHSITALITLSNVLVTGVALANPERALERLKHIDAFYEQADVTLDET